MIGMNPYDPMILPDLAKNAADSLMPNIFDRARDCIERMAAEIERMRAENERLNAGVRAIEAAAEKCESACKAMGSFQLQYEDQGQTSVRAKALRSAIAIFKQAAEAAKENQ